MSKTRFGPVRQLLRSLEKRERASAPALICGPCAIESPEQLTAVAKVGASLRAVALRGGAFKLRTDTRSFHGLGFEGWELLRKVSTQVGLFAVSEVTSSSQIEVAARCLDYIQIGARSMWNFELLESAARCGRPVVLKRGLGATTEDWLSAANRLSSYGAEHIVLCERGAPAHEYPSRNAVDFSTLIMIAVESPVPVWLDVSHSAGERSVVVELVRHARSLPLDAVMVEVHPDPSQAMCDASQAIDCDDLRRAWG